MRDKKNGYEKLEIYQLAHALAVRLHLSLTNLNKSDNFEEGSQIRRSSKSISSNIVEAFSRRRYKAEFIKFLVYSHGSCDETIEHLKLLFETNSISTDIYNELLGEYNILGRKLNSFIKSVELNHKTESVKSSKSHA